MSEALLQPHASRDSSRDRSRDQARAARRQAILEAAEAVFSEGGFSGATMAQIAARAGYSAGNLYNVFENKEALFAEVMTTRATLLLESIHPILSSNAPLGEILERYVERIVSFAAEHQGFFVLITQTHLDFDWHEASHTGGHVRREFDGSLVRLFERAIERGEIPRLDPRNCMSLVQGTLNSHLARWSRNRADQDALRKPADELLVLLKRAFGLA